MEYKRYTTETGIGFICRPVNPDDEGVLRAFYGGVSKRTLLSRLAFIGDTDETIDNEIDKTLHPDDPRDKTIVAVRAQGVEEIIGAVDYWMVGGHAEMGIMVAEEYRRMGVGSALMHQMLEYAMQQNAKWVDGKVQKTNEVSLHLLTETVKNFGLDIEVIPCPEHDWVFVMYRFPRPSST